MQQHCNLTASILHMQQNIHMRDFKPWAQRLRPFRRCYLGFTTTWRTKNVSSLLSTFLSIAGSNKPGNFKNGYWGMGSPVQASPWDMHSWEDPLFNWRSPCWRTQNAAFYPSPELWHHFCLWKLTDPAVIQSQSWTIPSNGLLSEDAHSSALWEPFPTLENQHRSITPTCHSRFFF